jgi:hypothetical protein
VACDEAVRIAAGGVLVHLKPAPTGRGAGDDRDGGHLARQPLLGVIVQPGPHERDGLWMTLWKFVAHDNTDPDPATAATGARSLAAGAACGARRLPR